MGKKNDDEVKNKNKAMENAIESLATRGKAPAFAFALLLILYLAAAIMMSMLAGSDKTIKMLGSEISLYAIAGTFSSIANISIIFLALYFGKPGFVTTLTLLIVQTPVILMAVLKQHNLNSLPGVFGNVLAAIAIVLIYLNNQKVDRYQTRLRDQAVTDRLTGLPNRFACSELVERFIDHGEKFAYVSIDLNHFKSINDTMGRNTGNDVLVEIASRWRNIAEEGLTKTKDILSRESGDEFSLLIRGHRSDAELRETIKCYEQVLSSSLTVDNCDFYITASFGYAEFPTDANNSDSLFTYADAAMQEVKRAGSSEHILRFSPELLKNERTLEIESMIRAALENDTVYFNLQPQFSTEKKLRGFEALARMRDSSGTAVTPSEFIPIAEKVGLIDKLDTSVFRKSAEFFGSVMKETDLDLTLSVNVSVRHLMKNDFLDEVQSVMRDHGIKAENLELEITESIMIDSAEKALQCISDIKKMGIRIAIDDFGTGYSSLSYLYKFPADLLKVDKSFIDKMNTNDSSKEYVGAIIKIGHIMGFDVISEGVEEQEQLDTLKSIGCDYIQGYVWGKPLSPDDARTLILSQSK